MGIPPKGEPFPEGYGQSVIVKAWEAHCLLMEAGETVTRACVFVVPPEAVVPDFVVSAETREAK